MSFGAKVKDVPPEKVSLDMEADGFRRGEMLVIFDFIELALAFREHIYSLANLPIAALNVSSLFAKQNRTTFWSNPPP